MRSRRQTGFSRRTLLGAAITLPLAGCGTDSEQRAPAATTTSSRTAAPIDSQFAQLERKYDARLGVFAVATGTGASLAYRVEERFAFCSTFKALAAAAVMARNPLTHLDTLVRYTAADIGSISPVTPKHLDTGMTIGELCDAAIRYSDGTAGNLLMRDIGGPAELTAYFRTLGDNVSRMDQFEPELNSNPPGDERDTTTPKAIGEDYRQLVLGDALPADKRARLTDWLERNLTGGQRIRAGVPKDWRVADKTGTGDWGRANDVAIVWPPISAPLVIAIMSDRTGYEAEASGPLVAEATSQIVAALT